MAETYFPKRLRCKTCRKGLTNIVLEKLYCSYRCANKPQPPNTVTDTPRHCKRQVNGTWDYKTKFRYEEEVPERLRNKPDTNIYLCDNCLFYHIGHSRVQEQDQEKMRITVFDMKTLGSIIGRRRLQLKWDKKSLAKDIKTIPIRITEIENGNTKIDAQVLFKLLSRLKIVVELIEK